MKAINLFFKKNKESLLFLVTNAKPKNKPGYYHKLRIEIRRLNSILHLLEFCSGDFKRKKAYSDFKSIFSQAGSVRELQIEETLLTKLSVNKQFASYIKYIRKRINKEQLIFFEVISTIRISRLKKKYNLIKANLYNMNRQKVEHFLKLLEKEKDQLIRTQNLDVPGLHKLRKRLKIYIFLRKLANQKRGYNPDNSLKTLLKLIGDWHDYQIVMNSLNKAISKGLLNHIETIHLEQMKSIINQKSKLLFKNINRMKFSLASFEN